MSIVRYQPFELLNELHRRLDRVFDTQAENTAGESSAMADWAPAADIAELKDCYVLKLDVPGVDAKAIEITLEQGQLTVQGQREREVGKTEAQSQRIERPHGRFYRRFTLPDTVDANDVRASGRDGVLVVTIPKRPQAQPRRIEVQSKG